MIIWAKSMAWGVRSMPMILIKLPPVSPDPIPGHHRVISGAKSANSSTHSLYKDFRQTILCFKIGKKRGISYVILHLSFGEFVHLKTISYLLKLEKYWKHSTLLNDTRRQSLKTYTVIQIADHSNLSN